MLNMENTGPEIPSDLAGPASFFPSFPNVDIHLGEGNGDAGFIKGQLHLLLQVVFDVPIILRVTPVSYTHLLLEHIWDSEADPFTNQVKVYISTCLLYTSRCV